MDRSKLGGEFNGFTANCQDSDTGTASRVSDAADSDPSSGRCTCQSYTVDLPAEDVEPRTGEVTQPSFERRSTVVYCPACGVNKDFRRSFAAHAAWVCRRSSYRRCDTWHVTVKLHPGDVSRLGLSSDDTRPVLSQLLPRLRKRLRRRDSDAEVLLSMSPRPSDGQWHLHVLLLSKECDYSDVMDAFGVDGTDVEITTPRSRQAEKNEPPMSAENFAAAISAYLFDNRVQGAVQGAETSFSSWGKGTGYFSEAARTRRREYAQMMSEAGGDSAPAPDARCPSTQFRTQDDRQSTDGPISGLNNRDEDGGEDGVSGGAAPVVVGEKVVQSEAMYRRVVIQALTDRLHSDVEVVGLGRCRLVWVEMDNDGGITCLVRPLELMDDDRREVPWRIVEAVQTPVIRSSTASTQRSDMDTNADTDLDTADDDGTDDTADDVATSYWQDAEHSRVSFVGEDSRHVRETVDGEVIRDEEIPL